MGDRRYDTFLVRRLRKSGRNATGKSGIVSDKCFMARLKTDFV